MTNEQTTLAGNVIRFAGFLKGRGFRVFQSSVHDALLSLEAIPLEEKGDFFLCLRANLAATDLEWAQFKGLFDQFWGELPLQEALPTDPPEPQRRVERPPSHGEPLAEAPLPFAVEMDVDRPREWLEGIVYSPVSVIQKKDLGRFNKADIPVARLALKQMTAPFRIEPTRRSRRGRKRGAMDFSRILKKSLKTGGTPFDLYYREKRRRLKRLVILADVSGSMDRYARFVMPFLMGLRGIGSRAEVFVFSTSLTPVTFLIRHLSVEQAINRIADEVPDWSGGTRIGYSLHQFNQGRGDRLLSRRTVVVILSDGWDLGGKDLLRREMAHLNRKAHAVIWLNPLAGDPDYEPLCRGMKTALPYVDYFLPVDSLQSLRRVGSVLARVMVH